MREPIDHELKLRLRASEWLAVRHLADADDRTMSGFVRQLIRERLAKESSKATDFDRDEEG
ncbi:MAG: hypothetical protein VBE63_18255 [Lamprobacter sp.]|uniref:hypothetical protein n=1 Tax=Lamprobacter sp. TaxID=3100796 RepID=UPI002B25B5C0|nr:hypothetical protein [Lamprobacter sp.]MEA3641858.1 hypothetical protein [Lamprobacter sp.]